MLDGHLSQRLLMPAAGRNTNFLRDFAARLSLCKDWQWRVDRAAVHAPFVLFIRRFRRPVSSTCSTRPCLFVRTLCWMSSVICHVSHMSYWMGRPLKHRECPDVLGVSNTYVNLLKMPSTSRHWLGRCFQFSPGAPHAIIMCLLDLALGVFAQSWPCWPLFIANLSRIPYTSLLSCAIMYVFTVPLHFQPLTLSCFSPSRQVQFPTIKHKCYCWCVQCYSSNWR